MTFTVTKEVKIITFQYKVIHNVLPTCTTLYRNGLIEDATCNLCNAMEHTLTHLLINCVTKAESWTSFQDWWCEKKSEIIKLSASHILYGWFDGTKHWQVLNYSLLIAKYSIFCTSLRGDELNFKSFLLLIHEKLEVLKEIATKNNSLSSYYHKWAFLV